MLPHSHDDRDDAPEDEEKDMAPSADLVFRSRLGAQRHCTHRCSCGAVLTCPDADQCHVPDPFVCPTCQRAADEAAADAMARHYGVDQ